jgi:hypothetical protein
VFLSGRLISVFGLALVFGVYFIKIGMPTDGSRKDFLSIPRARILADANANWRSSSSTGDPGTMKAHCPASARLLSCSDVVV